jgi:FkbM family methyltransferase
MSLFSRIRGAVRKTTFDVVRFNVSSHPLARRMRLFERHGIDLVLDVGANAGQYATQLRELGYRGRIVSFEPLSQPFAQLRRLAEEDGRWEAVRIGLAEKPGSARINLAANSVSSSLLPMLGAHLAAAPQSAYVGTEEITLDTLERAIPAHVGDGERPLLKIDAQGYERHILDGAGSQLARIAGIQLEMSLVPLYEGELLIEEMIALLKQRGFTLMSLEPGYVDLAAGQMLQSDGVFFRS